MIFLCVKIVLFSFFMCYTIIYNKEEIVYILIGVIITIAVLLVIAGLYSLFKARIEFYITGLDAKFSFSDLNLLWSVAEMCDLVIIAVIVTLLTTLYFAGIFA